MAEEIVGLKVKVDASEATKSLGEVRKEIKQANSDLLAAQQQFGDYSAEAIAAAKKVAQLKDSIQEARETADLFDPGKKFQVFAGALSAVAGGFSAVQGAIGLLGVESEEVEKSILKVQSALALSQGLSTIADSAKDFQRLGAVIQSTTAFQKINNAVTAATAAVMKALGIAAETTSTSFRVLKGAIAATGIGLLVVAVGELVNAFQNYTSAAEKAKKAQDDLNASASKGAKIDFETQTAALERQKSFAIAVAKNKGASEQEIFNIEQKFAKKKIDAQKTFIADTRDLSVEDQIQQERDLKKQQNDIEVAELNFQTSQNQKKKEQAKKDKEDAATKKKEAEAERKARREQELNDFVQFVNDRKAADDAELELQAFLIENQKKKEQELFDWRVNLQQQKYDESEEEFAFLQELNKKTLDNEQKTLDARLSAQLQFASSIGNVLGTLSGLFAQGTAASKIAAIAEIGLGTATGFIQGLDIAQKGAKATGPAAPFAFPIFYATQVAAILSAAGKAKQVLSQVKGGGSGVNLPSSSGLASAPVSPQLQTLNTVTQLDQGTINQMGSAAGRAYVVESDITNQQEKIVRINRAARLA
jgi:hypothetical protein